MDLVQSQTQSYSDESLCRLAPPATRWQRPSWSAAIHVWCECVPARFFWQAATARI